MLALTTRAHEPSAGSRDSALTNHGIQQARRLGDHLASTRPKLTHLFASPLQRAFKTADALRAAQATATGINSGLAVTEVASLVEQDFGFYEGKPFYARARDSTKTGREAHYENHKDRPGFVDVESKEALATRSDDFLEQHLLPLFRQSHQELVVAVVSHGILLSHLWRRFLRRLPPRSVTVTSEVVASQGRIILEHLGGWANTGFLEILIEASTTPAPITGNGNHVSSTVGHSNAATLISPAQPPSMPSLVPVRCSNSMGSDPAQSLLDNVNHGENDVATANLLSIADASSPSSSGQESLGHVVMLDSDHKTVSSSGDTPVPAADFAQNIFNAVTADFSSKNSWNAATVTHQTTNDLTPEDDSPALSAEAAAHDVAPKANSGIPKLDVLHGTATSILTVNGQEHLRGFKRTRGGIGRSRYDEGQTTMDSFFKRAKKT